MRIRLTKDDIPQWTDVHYSPIDLGNGLALVLKMIRNDDYSPGEYLPALVYDRSDEDLYDELVEGVEDAIRVMFYDAREYGDDISAGNVDLPTTSPPGMYVDDGGRAGWGGRHEHRYMPPRELDPDQDYRRRANYTDARLWRGWLRDDWCYVTLGAFIQFRGVEVGSAYCGGVEYGLKGSDDYILGIFAELAAEAWGEVRGNMEQMAGQLDAIGQTAVMNEPLEVEHGQD